MKKFLCYVAILLLILIIATPPLVRMFYEEEVIPEVKDEYYLLTCTKGNYSITQSYKNKEALSLKFERPLLDDNLSEYNDNNALEYVLDNELKGLVNANTIGDDENQRINYLLQFNAIVEEHLIKLNDYRFPLDDQISHYTAYGYTCEKIMQ